ncbi:MAG: N-6 DNA methylase [Hydrogenophaga sp.]|uniref:N-6 DNA methylase n=1 Tax=Hydrogenophaga sp. TaxID=1904254 RepID=UPI002755342C|nr:N-6 DNA methylase [Hydrogenophaga sp.]MDP2419484.1 N-6 DNA methylase [Hydrogenophaga sp.]MDZ4190049.1 N-6 DNA methylase [Hydrogenophaga sp.]
MGIDTDKYYTPPAVANRALERAQLVSKPIVCADTACGSGSLLIAAENVLNARYGVGIDSDPHAIQQLRRARPDWRLYVGDLLKRNRAPPTGFPGANYGVDLLVLNPPFSLGPRKYVTVKYLGRSVKCSVAMAHILRSFELFRPIQGAIAVVPESLLYSNTDQHARELLDHNFSFTELLQLSIYTFKGARVNSLFVQIAPQISRRDSSIQINTTQLDIIPVTVVRGGLQMHAFERSPSGARVIHSTALRSIATGGVATISDKTSSTAKGRISGWMLLLPRVGLPNKEAFCAFYSRDEVQLSDCVIGMTFPSKLEAFCVQRRIVANWQSLLSIYKGTGARYITIARFVDWLYDVGIRDCNALKKISGLTLV